MAPVQQLEQSRITVSLANQQDRQAIYHLRHEVYAAELGQHPFNLDGHPTDIGGDRAGQRQVTLRIGPEG